MSGLTRRLTRRFSLHVPLMVRPLDAPEVAAFPAETANISAGGALFTTELRLAAGKAVEMVLRMPEEIVGRPSHQWRCRGRVVRVDSDALTESETRVAVEFQYYEVLGARSVVDAKVRASAEVIGGAM